MTDSPDISGPRSRPPLGRKLKSVCIQPSVADISLAFDNADSSIIGAGRRRVSHTCVTTPPNVLHATPTALIPGSGNARQSPGNSARRSYTSSVPVIATGDKPASTSSDASRLGSTTFSPNIRHTADSGSSASDTVSVNSPTTTATAVMNGHSKKAMLAPSSGQSDTNSVQLCAIMTTLNQHSKLLHNLHQKLAALITSGPGRPTHTRVRHASCQTDRDTASRYSRRHTCSVAVNTCAELGVAVASTQTIDYHNQKDVPQAATVVRRRGDVERLQLVPEHDTIQCPPRVLQQATTSTTTEQLQRRRVREWVAGSWQDECDAGGDVEVTMRGLVVPSLPQPPTSPEPSVHVPPLDHFHELDNEHRDEVHHDDDDDDGCADSCDECGDEAAPQTPPDSHKLVPSRHLQHQQQQQQCQLPPTQTLNKPDRTFFENVMGQVNLILDSGGDESRDRGHGDAVLQQHDDNDEGDEEIQQVYDPVHRATLHHLKLAGVTLHQQLTSSTSPQAVDRMMMDCSAYPATAATVRCSSEMSLQLNALSLKYLDKHSNKVAGSQNNTVTSRGGVKSPQSSTQLHHGVSCPSSVPSVSARPSDCTVYGISSCNMSLATRNYMDKFCLAQQHQQQQQQQQRR